MNAAMKPVTASVLRAIAPRFSGATAQRQSHIIEAIAGDFTSILNEYEINTPLRVAHFLAQIIHESAGLQTTQEFASGAAYEGRVDLGNTVPGDGKRYKGRGVLQLTGRANYRRYGKILGLDLEGQPHIAAEPLISLRIACVYWRDRQINSLCDADDLVGVTRKVNGGRNGLADRGRYLVKAKAALAAPAAPIAFVGGVPTGPFVIPAADGPAGYTPETHQEASEALKVGSFWYGLWSHVVKVLGLPAALLGGGATATAQSGSLNDWVPMISFFKDHGWKIAAVIVLVLAAIEGYRYFQRQKVMAS